MREGIHVYMSIFNCFKSNILEQIFLKMHKACLLSDVKSVCMVEFSLLLVIHQAHLRWLHEGRYSKL